MKLKLNLNSDLSKIKNFDSLNHLNLMFAIQKEFKVKFSGTEIIDLENIGDIINLIIKKKFKS